MFNYRLYYLYKTKVLVLKKNIFEYFLYFKRNFQLYFINKRMPCMNKSYKSCDFRYKLFLYENCIASEYSLTSNQSNILYSIFFLKIFMVYY